VFSFSTWLLPRSSGRWLWPPDQVAEPVHFARLNNEVGYRIGRE
jgi:hypothetical protein